MGRTCHSSPQKNSELPCPGDFHLSGLSLGVQGGWSHFNTARSHKARVTLFAFGTNDLANFNLLWIAD